MVTQEKLDSVKRRIFAAVEAILAEEFGRQSDNSPENIVRKFVADACSLNTHDETQSSTLYQRFLRWKADNNIRIDFPHRVLSQTILRLQLPNVRLTKKASGSVFVGIRIND